MWRVFSLSRQAGCPRHIWQLPSQAALQLLLQLPLHRGLGCREFFAHVAGYSGSSHWDLGMNVGVKIFDTKLPGQLKMYFTCNNGAIKMSISTDQWCFILIVFCKRFSPISVLADVPHLGDNEAEVFRKRKGSLLGITTS